MKNRLNLTDEQEAKIRPIIEDQITKRGALIEKYQGQGREGMGSLKNEMQELSKTTENQLQSILTKEQMENYRNMQAEERQQMRKGSRGRSSGDLRGQRFFCEL
jgi:Spy/CpxP family protein refolding chaperone